MGVERALGEDSIDHQGYPRVFVSCQYPSSVKFLAYSFQFSIPNQYQETRFVIVIVRANCIFRDGVGGRPLTSINSQSW